MQNGELYLQQENWLKVKLSASLQDDCLASLVSHFLNLWGASHLSALKNRERNKGGDLGKCMSCLFWMSVRNISPLLQLQSPFCRLIVTLKTYHCSHVHKHTSCFNLVVCQLRNETLTEHGGETVFLWRWLNEIEMAIKLVNYQLEV